VALVIGVIVAGLGIGALISAYQNRGTPPPQLGAGVPPVTPVPLATAAPEESPLAMMSATPSPRPSPSPASSPQPTASPSPEPTVSPTPEATALPSPSPAPTASPTLAATATPLATAPPTAKPTVAPAPAATPRVTPAPVPAEGHGGEATAAVRRYLDAVIAGNTSAAAAMLAPGGTVKEAAVLDNASHVIGVRVTRSDAAGAFVEAQIATSNGSYIATFHVTITPGGASIDQHDYIKV